MSFIARKRYLLRSDYGAEPGSPMAPDRPAGQRRTLTSGCFVVNGGTDISIGPSDGSMRGSARIRSGVTPISAPATTLSLFAALFGVFCTAVVVSQFVGLAQDAKREPPDAVWRGRLVGKQRETTTYMNCRPRAPAQLPRSRLACLDLSLPNFARYQDCCSALLI